MRDGFIKVAAGTPKIRVADCRYNAEQIFTMMREADKQGVKVLCLPELCLTGYTCGDLFLQDTLLRGAEEALACVLTEPAGLDLVAALFGGSASVLSRVVYVLICLAALWSITLFFREDPVERRAKGNA